MEYPKRSRPGRKIQLPYVDRKIFRNIYTMSIALFYILSWLAFIIGSMSFWYTQLHFTHTYVHHISYMHTYTWTVGHLNGKNVMQMSRKAVLVRGSRSFFRGWMDRGMRQAASGNRQPAAVGDPFPMRGDPENRISVQPFRPVHLSVCDFSLYVCIRISQNLRIN